MTNPLHEQELPDLRTIDMWNEVGGGVSVIIKNFGGDPQGRQTDVDVFFGLAEAPAVGAFSPHFVTTAIPGPNQQVTLWFDNVMDAPGWVDVIVDTTQRVPESREDNNVTSRELAFVAQLGRDD